MTERTDVPWAGRTPLIVATSLWVRWRTDGTLETRSEDVTAAREFELRNAGWHLPSETPPARAISQEAPPRRLTEDEIKAHDRQPACSDMTIAYDDEARGGIGWHCHGCGAGGRCVVHCVSPEAQRRYGNLGGVGWGG